MGIFAQCFLFIMYSFLLIAAIWFIVNSMLKADAPASEPVIKRVEQGGKDADNSVN